MPESTRHLKRPPLAEALVEVKWAGSPEGRELTDPGYPLIVGRLYERLQGEYPFVEELLPADVPVAMTMHVVRHRFRSAAGAWPLVQVGPGVLTLNETTGYRWGSFKERAVTLLPKLYEAYPSTHPLKVKSLILRYVNSYGFDFENADVLEFLQAKMKTTIGLPRGLLDDPRVQRWPLGFRLNVTFPVAEPKGVLDVNWGVGQAAGQRSLIWEFVVRSLDADVPSLPSGFPAWLATAHDLVERWFFELVRGDLLSEFDRS
jgi:uncharacterized protein (TIGR04255 family)